MSESKPPSSLVPCFRPGAGPFAVLVALGCSLLPLGVHADVVTLKSGIRYYDVRARPRGNLHVVLFQDGRVRRVPNSAIRSLRPGPTTWSKAKRASVPRPLGPVRVESEVPEVAALSRIPRERFALDSLPLRPRLYEPAGAELRPAQPSREWGPILKSALLPGWGQYATGRRWTGWAYAGTSLLFLERYWTVRRRHTAAEADYNDPLPVGAVAAQSLTGAIGVGEAAAINLAYLSGKERAVYRLQKRGNNMALLFGLSWVGNILDILHGGPPWEKPWLTAAKAQPTVAWDLRVSPGSFLFVVSMRL